MSAGAERLGTAFRGHGRRAALMPYLMGGFPSLERSEAIGAACAAAGADVLELGVPFSDPLADGPVIQAAGSAALAAGATLDGVLEVGEALARRVPVVLMCYMNLVHARGADAFPALLAGRGISGLIVPDLPMEEAPDLLGHCDAEGVALVPLVAPTTPDERLATIVGRARGFLYTVSVTGTTGERAGHGGALREVVGRASRAAPDGLPVAVGFGITEPEDAAAAADAGADGVIIGSRLVRAAAEAEDPAAEVGARVRAFAEALG